MVFSNTSSGASNIFSGQNGLLGGSAASNNTSLFGQTSTANTNSEPAAFSKLFGTESSKQEASSSTPSLAVSSSSTTGGLFSIQPATSNTFKFGDASATGPKSEINKQTSSASPFGGLQATSNSIFSTTTTGTSTPAKAFSFNTSTTPAGPPPKENPQVSQSSLFEPSKTSEGSIFGGNSSESTSLFGKAGSIFNTTKTSSPLGTSSTSQAPQSTFATSSDTSNKLPATHSEKSASSVTFGAPVSNAQTSSAPTVKSGLFSATTNSETTSSASISASTTALSSAPAFSFPSSGGTKPDVPTTSASSATTLPNTLSTKASSAPSQPNAAATSASNSGTTTATTNATATLSGNTPLYCSSTIGPNPQLARLKNKTMDEIITHWASDLSKYQKEFQEQASKVAAWDRLMVDNGEKIQKLYLSTFEAERQNAEIERQLVSVENQQDEIACWLDRYESEIDEMFSRQVRQGEILQGPDQEREKIYKLAEKLTDRLDEMGKNLTSMIDAINDASCTLSKTGKADDPLSSIVRVLNNHLTMLQWIDENAEALKSKVEESQKVGNVMGPY